MPDFWTFITDRFIAIFSAFTMLLLVIVFNNSSAQDLESIGKSKPIKISGSLGTTQTYYTSSGIPNRRPPYLWYLNGSLNINIYGLSLPFSAFWSNQTKGYRQPFNQVGLSPKYKWVTGHLGYRSLNWSPYTLSGHTFLGAAVDMNPGILRLSAMYGRLYKAIEEDTLNTGITPSFQRIGYGAKIGVGKDADFIDFIFFKAKDDINSLSHVPVKSDVTPAENMVFSINAQKQLMKKILFAVEYASSAYTRDTRASKTNEERKNIFTPFYTQKNSTQFFHALRSNLSYNAEWYSVAFAYERIEPEYRTLGTYFFNNDLENITIAPSVRLFQQKINLNVNAGIQKDNILKTQTSTTKRVLTSVNLSFIPGQSWSFVGQYSNFVTYNRLSSKYSQIQQVDTLNFYQVNESASLNTGFNSKGKDRKHGINLSLTYQRANQTQGESVVNNTSRFYNSNLSYRYTIVPVNLSITAGVNGNQSNTAGISTIALGPTLGANKTFFDKKVRAMLSSTLNNVYTESDLTARALNFTFNTGYTYLKKHNFTLTMNLLNRFAKSSGVKSYTEFTGMFGYGYSF